MKKEYIAPESRLFAINISENIADSIGGDIGGSSEISGSAVIQFYQYADGCRKIYTRVETALVNPSYTTFPQFYNELLGYGADVYFNCFRYQFG